MVMERDSAGWLRVVVAWTSMGKGGSWNLGQEDGVDVQLLSLVDSVLKGRRARRFGGHMEVLRYRFGYEGKSLKIPGRR